MEEKERKKKRGSEPTTTGLSHARTIIKVFQIIKAETTTAEKFNNWETIWRGDDSLSSLNESITIEEGKERRNGEKETPRKTKKKKEKDFLDT